ncbi:hypothetical protein FACS189428_0510 [Clostridia bacterium]|nr:hypothetical protein FACS189428_0510 [Clostridia bacterium]
MRFNQIFSIFLPLEMKQQLILSQCRQLLQAYQEGKLGYMKMPEDENPGFSEPEREEKICYFTLPMALNYQRNSYKLRESALTTRNDPTTREVFSIHASSQLSKDQLREKLMKYKVALQPNKHIETRSTISQTVFTHWGDLSTLLASTNYDFLQLKTLIQTTHKKGFPYLSGPKIFNYWSYILQRY